MKSILFFKKFRLKKKNRLLTNTYQNLAKKKNDLLGWFCFLQVAPAELEAILLTHPSIEDAAVFP